MNLKIGSSVKLNLNNLEKIWVEVTEIEGSNIKGKVDENPIKLEDVYFGDEVNFNLENIIEILN
jgi:uncharacterized protein YegJ (DUF2314 family)